MRCRQCVENFREENVRRQRAKGPEDSSGSSWNLNARYVVRSEKSNAIEMGEKSEENRAMATVAG